MKVDRILRIRTVKDRTGLSRATIYREIKRGRFPQQVQISIGCVGWRESAIREWQDSRPKAFETRR